MKYTFVLFAVFILLAAGCKSSKGLVATSSDLDGSWGVVEMNGEKLDPSQTNQRLIFDLARLSVSGNTGCNTLAGKVEFSEKQKEVIRLLNVVSTRKGCMDMSGENAMLKAIREVARFEIADQVAPIDTVTFYGMTGEKLMTLAKNR